jgi:hypothetical protein
MSSFLDMGAVGLPDRRHQGGEKVVAVILG